MNLILRIKIAGIAALAAIATLGQPVTGRSQTFSHAVILLSGIVRSDESLKPTSVRVSVREIGDTARELTCSTSNRETGKYLVVLKPGKRYWVHLEGDSILTKDELVETPTTEQTQQLRRNFDVTLRETDEATKLQVPSTQQN